jgi:hypothetical protein
VKGRFRLSRGGLSHIWNMQNPTLPTAAAGGLTAVAFVAKQARSVRLAPLPPSIVGIFALSGSSEHTFHLFLFNRP